MEMVMYLFGDLFPDQGFYWVFAVMVPVMILTADQLSVATLAAEGKWRTRAIPTRGEQIAILLFAAVVIFVPVINAFAAVITAANAIHQLGVYCMVRAMRRSVKS